MADIDVVPKRRTSVWIWVIAAVVLFFLFSTGEGQTRPVSGLLGPSLPLSATVAV
jgi:hypothetical protein